MDKVTFNKPKISDDDPEVSVALNAERVNKNADDNDIDTATLYGDNDGFVTRATVVPYHSGTFGLLKITDSEKLRKRMKTLKYIPEINANTLRSIPRPLNHNLYATKKTMAEGMLDVALLTANASQLKSILQTDGKHDYYLFLLIILILSIILQLIVGILLLYLARLDISNEDQQQRADLINNISMAGICLITVANIFISAFGISNESTSNIGFLVNADHAPQITM